MLALVSPRLEEDGRRSPSASMPLATWCCATSGLVTVTSPNSRVAGVISTPQSTDFRTGCIHPEGVVGRTNIIGHVRSARGLRTEMLAVNGAGNLSHSARATVKVRLHSPSGSVRVGEIEFAAFTGKVTWVDELFEGMAGFLGDGGYGTVLVTCSDADVNCQILTCSTAGSVSLQHMWGY